MKKVIAIVLVLISFNAVAGPSDSALYQKQWLKWRMKVAFWMDNGAYINNIPKTSGQNRFLVYDSSTNKIGYRYVGSSATPTLWEVTHKGDSTDKTIEVGGLTLNGALMPNSDAGTTGQVLTSAGSGSPPTWETPSNDVHYTYRVDAHRYSTTVPWDTTTDGAEAFFINDTLFQIAGWFTGTEQYYSLNDSDFIAARDGDYSSRHAFAFTKKGNYYYMPGDNSSGSQQDWVWRSRNGLNWDTMTNNAPWDIPRFYTAGWTIGDTIFTGGGQETYNSTDPIYRDVWKSGNNGADWTLNCASCLPDYGNLSGTFATKNDTAYIIGGGTFFTDGGGTYITSKKVYRSTNHLRTWDYVTDLPDLDTGLMFPKVFTIGSRICVYGGNTIGDIAYNQNKLFCSYDGENWTNYTQDNFPTTHAAAIAVKDDSTFFITSGSMIGKIYRFDFNRIHENRSGRIAFYSTENTITDTSKLSYIGGKMAIGRDTALTTLDVVGTSMVTGSGTTSTTQALVVKNSAGDTSFVIKNDRSTHIYGNIWLDGANYGTQTIRAKNALYFLDIKNWDGQRVAHIDMNNNGGVAFNRSEALGDGAFSVNGTSGANSANGLNSFSAGNNSIAEGANSFAYGRFGKARFRNQTIIGNGINTAQGNSKVVTGIQAASISQNTNIDIDSFDFTNYVSSYTAFIAKVTSTIVSASQETQTIVEYFTVDCASSMAQIGATDRIYDGGDAAMSTGAMVYTYSGKQIKLSYKTPTVHATDNYNVHVVFEFDMIGY